MRRPTCLNWLRWTYRKLAITNHILLNYNLIFTWQFIYIPNIPIDNIILNILRYLFPQVPHIDIYLIIIIEFFFIWHKAITITITRLEVNPLHNFLAKLLLVLILLYFLLHGNCSLGYSIVINRFIAYFAGWAGKLLLFTHGNRLRRDCTLRMR